MPPRLYTDLAYLWPRLSPPEDYAPEAGIIRRVLTDHGLEPGAGRTLVEFGAGGGHSLHHLREGYACTAVDRSEAMLEQCRTLNPGLPTHVGDMRSARLGRTFDAVLIHDAIDYLTTEADLAAALDTAAAHLAPDGLLLVAPTYTRETFEDGQLEIDAPAPGSESGSGRSEGGDDPAPAAGDRLVYTSLVRDPDPSDTTFELTLTYHLTDPRTGQTEAIDDVHTCGLFAEADWLRLLDAAGFDATIDDADELPWTLFVARKR